MDEILKEAGKYEPLITLLALVLLIWYTVETFLLRKSSEQQIKLLKRQIASDLVPKVMVRDAVPKGAHIISFYSYRNSALEVDVNERIRHRNTFLRGFISEGLNPGIFDLTVENLSHSEVYDVEVLFFDKKLNLVFTCYIEKIPSKNTETGWIRLIPISIREALNKINDKYGYDVKNTVSPFLYGNENSVVSLSLDRVGNVYMSSWNFSYVEEERIKVFKWGIKDRLLE